MKDVENPKDLIMSRVGGFTRQQQILAEYLLEHMDEVPFLSVPVLARAAAVSEATVVRFAQRLGFKGYSELKGAFVAHLKAHHLEPKANRKGAGSIWSQVIGQDAANVSRCLELNEDGRFLAAVGAVAMAKTVFCFGAGASSLMAEYFAYLLTQIGVRSGFLSPRYSSPLEQLVTVEADDLLCCFSFPPYSSITIRLLEEARKGGCSTLVFCDRFAAPATQYADHVLAAPSEGMMFTNSMTAVTALLNALITWLGKHMGPQTLSAVDRINRYLDNDPDVMR